MLPEVEGFTPSAWINLLTMQERAALAAPFTEYVAAVRAIESVDEKSRIPQAIAEDYVQARQYLDTRIPLVVQHVSSWLKQPRPDPLPKLFPYDPGGRMHTSSHSESAVYRIHSLVMHRNKLRRRKVVDICSGQQSLAQYVLVMDASAIVLSIDIIPRNEALHDVPDHLRHRVKYVQLDIRTLGMSTLTALVREHLSCSIEEVHSIHFSPCCKSYSDADAGRTGYRLPDGRPNPTPRDVQGRLRLDRYEYAREWDSIVTKMFALFQQVIQVSTDILISVENPTAAFRLHPAVVSAIADKSSGFRLLEVDYCKTAHPDFDGGKVFTQKPTDFIVRGVRSAPFFSLPKCNRDCRFRFPDHTGKSFYHLRSMRSPRITTNSPSLTSAVIQAESERAPGDLNCRPVAF